MNNKKINIVPLVIWSSLALIILLILILAGVKWVENNMPNIVIDYFPSSQKKIEAYAKLIAPKLVQIIIFLMK